MYHCHSCSFVTDSQTDFIVHLSKKLEIEECSYCNTRLTRKHNSKDSHIANMVKFHLFETYTHYHKSHELDRKPPTDMEKLMFLDITDMNWEDRDDSLFVTKSNNCIKRQNIKTILQYLDGPRSDFKDKYYFGPIPIDCIDCTDLI